MYISIHRKDLRFLHKHESVRTVCDLDFINAGNQHVDVTFLGAPNFLRDLTETELQRLYRHTTGQMEDSPHHGDALRNVLAELADRFPCTDANAFEADRQAAWIETNDDARLRAFQYTRGTSKPAEAPDEPGPPALVTLTNEEAAIAARRRAAPAPQPTGAGGGSSGAEPAPRPVHVVMQARQAGKTTTVIFQVADRMWEEAGKPTRLDEVLALRKKMMDELERVGIKRTTSSSALGAWQKARI